MKKITLFIYFTISKMRSFVTCCCLDRQLDAFFVPRDCACPPLNPLSFTALQTLHQGSSDKTPIRSSWKAQSHIKGLDYELNPLSFTALQTLDLKSDNFFYQ